MKVEVLSYVSKLLALLMLMASLAAAQFQGPARNVRAGTSLPATCSAGGSASDIFIKTNATSTQEVYVCTAPNTWTQQGGGTPVVLPTTPNLIKGDNAGGAADSGILPANVMQGPASAAANAVFSSNGTGGKTAQDSGCTAASAVATCTTFVGALTGHASLDAPIASPTFTGTVTIPNGGIFGTPTSMTATNVTGLPAAGVTGTAVVGGGNLTNTNCVLYRVSAGTAGCSANLTTNGTDLLTFLAGAAQRAYIYWGSPQQFGMGSGMVAAWGNGTDFATATLDTSLDRDAAGIVGVTNGTQGTTAANYRDVKARHSLAAGSAPSITSGDGGTASAIAGADGAGRITVGTSIATGSIMVALGTAYPNASHCDATDETNAATIVAVCTFTTTSQLTITGYSRTTGIAANFTASDVVSWGIPHGY